MATFKNISTQFDFSNDNQLQINWRTFLSVYRGRKLGVGGYGYNFNFTQVLDSKGQPSNDIINFSELKIGYVSGNYTSVDYDYIVRDTDDIARVDVNGKNDVVLLIETQPVKLDYDYVGECSRELTNGQITDTIINPYDKNTFLSKYGDYIEIKSIKLYAGFSNNRSDIFGGNVLNMIIKQFNLTDSYQRYSDNYVELNYSTFKTSDLAIYVEVNDFFNNPILPQALNFYNNKNEDVIGISQFYTMPTTSSNYFNGVNYKLIFKSKDDLIKILNLYQLPYTFDINQAKNTSVKDLSDGFKPLDATPGGSSKPDGGDGNFDNTSDVIELPESSFTSAITSGFISVWNPTLVEINALSRLLWNDDVIIQALLHLFGNATDAIIGLYSIPFIPYTTEPNKKEIILGNKKTGITAYHVINQIADFNCGQLNVEKYWGNALDYSPYTKIELFLPFIGMVSLNPDDVMGKTIAIDYTCDVVSGACIAFISVNGSVLYTYQGNCITNIPITSQNFSQLTSAIISAGVNVAGAVATGGATIATDGLMSATSVLTAKAPIQHSGSLTGSSGMMGVRTPYLIITRPVQSIPENYEKYRGFPSNITATLGNLSGYTEVEYIHLDGFDTATSTELEQIEQLLKEGVIL